MNINRKIYFVMPAYNEAANIEEVISEWHPVVEACGSDSRLVIANDGSKDNTFHIMQELMDRYPRLVALDKANSGHGPTLLYLYRYAIDNGASHVFQTDSDGQTRPDEFKPMLDNIDQYELQIGTRGGRQDGFGRKVVTRVLRLVVWLTFGVNVKDANTPFRLMRTDSLTALMKKIPQDFFLSNVAIAALAVKNGHSIGWHPITFRPRQGGVNSINLRRIIKIGIKAIRDLHKIARQ